LFVSACSFGASGSAFRVHDVPGCMLTAAEVTRQSGLSMSSAVDAGAHTALPDGERLCVYSGPGRERVSIQVMLTDDDGAFTEQRKQLATAPDVSSVAVGDEAARGVTIRDFGSRITIVARVGAGYLRVDVDAPYALDTSAPVRAERLANACVKAMTA
jgi:hypothetical protein